MTVCVCDKGDTVANGVGLGFVYKQQEFTHIYTIQYYLCGYGYISWFPILHYEMFWDSVGQ